MSKPDLDINNEKSIKKNSFFSFLTTSLRVIANIFLFWTIARFYGPEIFGQFTYAFTVITIFLYLADFGLDILLTTDLPKDLSRLNIVFNELLTIKIIFICISSLLLFVYALLVKISNDVFHLLVILNFYLIATSFLNYLFAFFRAQERLEIETKITFIYNLFVIITVSLLYFFKLDVVYLAVCLVLFRLLALYIALLKSLKYIDKIRIKINFALLKKYKDKVSVFGTHYIFNYLYYNIDTVLLAYLIGEKSVGIFQAAFKLLVILLIIPEIIINALLPALSRLNNENKLIWESYSSLFNKLLMIIIFPAAILIFTNAHNIIDTVYADSQYSYSAEVLKYYVLIITIRFMIEPLGLLLTTSNKQHIRAYTVLFVTIISIAMNIVLIQKYGVLGVVLTGFVTNSIILITYIFFSYEICQKWYVNTKFVYFIFSVILFGITVLFIKLLIVQFLLYLIYLVTFGYFIFLNKDEKELIKAYK
ncbi:oligosaccharide flippase family protein [Melioribacter sp. Ez-97]|uniref:oligosaccharide flippase family protein n=1 Tax=Melioribacter sp. Ez-97 TaxID=3423434 RepID=UPI003EDAC6AC